MLLWCLLSISLDNGNSISEFPGGLYILKMKFKSEKTPFNIRVKGSDDKTYILSYLPGKYLTILFWESFYLHDLTQKFAWFLAARQGS